MVEIRCLPLLQGYNQGGQVCSCPESRHCRSAGVLMDQLNKNLTFVVGAVVVLTIALASGRGEREPINDPWFSQAVLGSQTPVVVKFGADWCGPCRSMDAAIDSLEPRYSGRAKFLKINVDKNPELFANYRSGSGIPQIMIFKGGHIVAQQRGFGGEDGLKQWLEDSL